ncbi:hypothetical protein NESM_000276100 [Novymonas esmeraldas]|uniref:Uncharacterized protein n=1 Tax=Novymonas esmeraldas TaxID=1808958 RepID=A0AAW0F7W6_9TRYP
MRTQSEKELAIALLQELKATTTPKFVNSGEALTYLACKDEVLGRVIALLSSARSEPVPEEHQALNVNHQQLANAVIDRTFDAHTQILRSKLAEAEKEAAMWKRVALFGGAAGAPSPSCTSLTLSDVATPLRISCATQASSPRHSAPEPRRKSSAQQSRPSRESVEDWLAQLSSGMMSALDAKLEYWRSSQMCLAADERASLRQLTALSPSVDEDAKTPEKRSIRDPPAFKMDDTTLDSGKVGRTEKSKGSEHMTSTLLVFPSSAHTNSRFGASPLPPSLSRATVRLQENTPSNSPLYVLGSMSLKVRKARPSSKHRAATSNGRRSGNPRLPQI